MAKKKIYAVRKGHKTGLFNTWAECQKATAGYSGAERYHPAAGAGRWRSGAAGRPRREYRF